MEFIKTKITKKENRIIIGTNLNLNYSISIVEYEKTDV